MYWRPLPMVPPSPQRASRASFPSAPPRASKREPDAELRPSGPWDLLPVKLTLPHFRDHDGEPLSMWRVFIADALAGVAIDRQCSGLHPRGRRRFASTDRLPDDADRIDPRGDDLSAILRSVAAVNALARQIYNGGCAVQRLCPRPERLAIPRQFATAWRGRPRRPRQDNHFHAVGNQISGESLAEKPAPASEDNTLRHRSPSPSDRHRAKRLSVGVAKAIEHSDPSSPLARF